MTKKFKPPFVRDRAVILDDIAYAESILKRNPNDKRLKQTLKELNGELNNLNEKAIERSKALSKLQKENNLLKEKLNVLDCIKYDTCTLADSSKNTFDNLNQYSEFTRYEEYGALTEKVSGTYAIIQISNLPNPIIIDYEYLMVDGIVESCGINVFNNTTYLNYISPSDIGYTSSIMNTWVKLRLTIDGTSFTLTSLDDPTKTITKTTSSDINKVGWNTDSSVSEIRLRNLKIYPI